MSDPTLTGGRMPHSMKATGRDAAGLALLVLGTFVAASAAWDGWQDLAGAGANRSTAAVVRLIGWLGHWPLVAGGAVLAIAGAFLFGRRERVLPGPLALSLTALFLALPFAGAAAAPGVGGALGDLAAPAGAGWGARVLALALCVTFLGASTYALFAAFGRHQAVLGLVRAGVSGGDRAVKEKGGPRPAAATPRNDHGSAQGEGAHPRAAERGAAGDGAAAGGQRAGADLAAGAAGGAIAAAAGTAAPRPLARPAADARPAGTAGEGLTSAGGRRASLAPEDGMRLVVGGRVVEPETPFAGAEELDAAVAFAPAETGAVRPLGAAAVRPLGTTPPPPPPPAPLSAEEAPGASRARPLGSAPAIDPSAELAPLPAGSVGGEHARELGAAGAAAATIGSTGVVAAPATWRMDASGVVHPAAVAEPEVAAEEVDDDVAAELEDDEVLEADVDELAALDDEDDAAELLEDALDDEDEAFEDDEDEDEDSYEVEDELAEDTEEEEESEEASDDDDEEETDEVEDDDAELADEAEEEDEFELFADADEDDASDDDEEADEDADDSEADDDDVLEDELDALDDDEVIEEEASDDDAELAAEVDEDVDAEVDEADEADDAEVAAEAVVTPPAPAPAPAAARHEPLDLFADAGIEEGVGRPMPEAVVIPAPPRPRTTRTAASATEHAAPALATPAPAAPKRARKKAAAAAPAELADDAKEQLIHQAGLLFLEEGRVAVSLLQKRFALDFQRSTEILDALQDRGLIGPYLGGQRRDILMTRDAWVSAQAAR